MMQVNLNEKNTIRSVIKSIRGFLILLLQQFLFWLFYKMWPMFDLHSTGWEKSAIDSLYNIWKPIFKGNLKN